MTQLLSGFGYSAATERLIKVWRTLPKVSGELCPRKNAFAPLSLGKELKKVVLLEYIKPTEVIVRVIGTEIQDLIHLNMTGRNIFEILPPEHAIAHSNYYKSLCDYPCAGSTERPMRNRSGHAHLACTLHLPLGDDNGNVRYLLGVVEQAVLPKHFTDYRSIGITSANNLSMSYGDIGAGIPDEEAYFVTRAAL